MLKNGLCRFKQILPHTKKLINYFNDNWLCNAPRFDWPILFVHSFGGRSLIISFSHLIIQNVSSKTWMQIRVHDQKYIFRKVMILRNMIKKITWSFVSNYCFLARNKMNHFFEIINNYQNGIIWKSVAIEDHGDVRIGNN
jgi:hypothetical protein